MIDIHQLMVKQCHIYHPFSWEWFIYTTYIDGDFSWGMVQMAL
jgi:hypothetical protein